MAYWAPNVFGTFEKRAPERCDDDVKPHFQVNNTVC